MASAGTGLGLGEVVELALRLRSPNPLQAGVAGSPFGAAGSRREGGVDPELLSSLGTDGPADAIAIADPLSRLLGTALGRRSAAAIGSEARTLLALDRLSVEILARTLGATGQARPQDRLLVLPRREATPPVLLVMSEDVADAAASRVVSDTVDLSLGLVSAASKDVMGATAPDPETIVFEQLLGAGARAMAELFLVSRPEVVLTRRPRMIRLSVPTPHWRVEAGGSLSTAGMLCRDATGELGITACYHGTGPVGTPVTVGMQQSHVKLASEVQDIVFIPLRSGMNIPDLVGANGVLQDREPARADHVRFDGAVNQERATRIFGTDAGLLRARPSIMLKLQTDPDTDQGDSGSALRNGAEQVLGFAFERTAYDDYPQFTDWIWAANALRALSLTPFTSGE